MYLYLNRKLLHENISLYLQLNPVLGMNKREEGKERGQRRGREEGRKEHTAFLMHILYFTCTFEEIVINLS